MANKRFYWLKLNQDFFKRNDIMVVENMPNGKDYILFYLKLLLASVSNNGQLRFSDTIPYDEKMLSVITNTDIDVVRSAMKVFTQMGMIEVLDDQTIFMTEIEKMTGSAVDNENANRQRRFREKKKQQALPERYESVTKNNESIEIDKEKDIELELDVKENKQKKTTRFVPPTVEEVQDYINVMGYHIDANYFMDYYESKGWLVGRTKMKDWKATVRNWARRDKETKPTNSNPFADNRNDYTQALMNFAQEDSNNDETGIGFSI